MTLNTGDRLLNTWPSFDADDISLASSILNSGKVNYWTGPEGKSFEKEFAEWIGVPYSVACCNGSLALSCAYLALGLSIGDEIITSSRSFIATASSAALLKLKPIFADVNINSGCITSETIAPLITPRTKAISVVHFAGWPADMDSICDLAKSYGLFVIEDCAQAHGARILIDGTWQSVGSLGDVSAWSFCQDKVMSTAGEGGMVATSNSKFWELIWSFKDHGKSWDAVNSSFQAPGFKWLHDNFGSNFRLTEIQSAIGRNQLKKMSDWTKLRLRNAHILINSLSILPVIRIPQPEYGFHHAWYKFYCYIDSEALSADWNRDRIISEINSLGYPAFHGGCSEVYLEKCFVRSDLTPKNHLPIARLLGDTSLMLLVHPTITFEQMHSYAKSVYSVLKSACR